MHDTLIRRHLSAVRTLVLEIVGDKQPVSAGMIIAEWASRHPELTPRHRAALPRMTGQILWRLENLEWVESADGGYRLNDLGAQARKIGQSDH